MKTMRARHVVWAIAGAVAWAAPAHAFTVDGVLSADDTYTATLSVPFNVTGGSISSATGTLRIGRGSNSDGTGGANDIFLLLEVPTDLKDLSYGANKVNSWGSIDHPFSKAQGSEKWAFSLNISGLGDKDKKVELKLKDVADPDSNLTKNAGGKVLKGRTSLDHNLALFPDPTAVTASDGTTIVNLKQDSPPLADTTSTDDATQYASVDSVFADWEFAQIYELQIDGGASFGSTEFLSDLSKFQANITIAEVHASPNKAGGNNVLTLDCLNGTTTGCTPTTTNGQVPEPATLAMFGIGLLGLARLRRRRFAA